MNTRSRWLCMLAAIWSLFGGATGAAALGLLHGADGARTTAKVAARVRSVQVIDCPSYLFTVDDLDRSLAFYHDVLGLAVLVSPHPPAPSANVERLTSTPGALFRNAALQLPDGTQRLMLMQFTRIDRRHLRPRIVDPGAVMLDVRVARLDAVLEAARRFGARVLTPGSSPVTEPSGERAIVLVDPDGFYLRLWQSVQPGATPADAAEGGATSARLVFTTAEPGPVLRFYHDVLGLAVDPGRLTIDRGFDQLIAAPGARLDLLRTRTGNAELLRFAVFAGVTRHTYLPRPQDPGAAGAVLRVADLAAAMRRIRAASARVVSAGGQPVVTTQGQRTILIRDPAGLLLELVQR